MIEKLNRLEKDRERKNLGKKGEFIAERFLVKRGFSIITKNYLKSCGEIDIVAKKSNKLYFCEVKTVSREKKSFNHPNVNHETYLPEENVHKNKLIRLKRVIVSYLRENNVSHETDWEILVVAIKLDTKARVGRISLIEC